MMTEEQRRFEQWVVGIYHTRLLKDEKGNYRSQVLQQLWQAWQAALTQPAGPALKLHEVPPNALVALCEQMYDHRSTGVTVAHDVWQDCIEELRIDVPHTAPIEPICATGGAEWVKVSDKRLKEISDCDGFMPENQEVFSIANELLAVRSRPIPDEFLNAQQNASGMFEISEDCMCQLLSMLCSKP